MYYPMREADFVEGWMDISPDLPVPKINWIKEKHLDISYGSNSLQKFDLYFPEKKEKALPLVIIVHGGGFFGMDKRDWHLYPGFFALKEGFALASINYRLAPKSKYPMGLNDVKAAIRFLKKNADKYGISTKNFFLYGTSAGGNLASIAALEGALEHSDFQVNSVAALCAAFNIETMRKNSKNFKDKVQSLALIMIYLGLSAVINKSIVQKASANTYISKNAPPFFIQHGTKDIEVPISQSYQFYDELKLATGLGEKDLKLYIMENAGHAGSDIHYFAPENILPAIEFFKAHIKKENNHVHEN